MVSAAIFGFIVSLWMLLYVFQKMCDGTLTGNQIMGVLLLMGVMGLFASVVPWLLPPNEIVCAVRHFMHPLLMVLCFSILLVKSMQLRSLVTIGLGGSIPIVNQMVSLIFMVMVQLVIIIEWYLTTKPIGIAMTNGYPECGVSKSRFLLLHIYPTVLLLLSFFYGISVIKVKRNFNEGRWITMATIFIIPIFAAWPIVYYFAPVPFHDPSVAVSVLAVAGIILSTIFLPKMHTIAQQNQLKASDLSRTHSDATVYTGFSDYVTMASNRSNKRLLYPVYGYTTNQFVPNNDEKKKKRAKKRTNDNFPYVSPVSAASTGPNVKSFNDWSREYSPNMTHVQKHYKTPKNLVTKNPANNSNAEAQYKVSSSMDDNSARHNKNNRTRNLIQPPIINRNVMDDSTLETTTSSTSHQSSKRHRSQNSASDTLNTLASSSNWTQQQRRDRSRTPGESKTSTSRYYFDQRSLNRQRHSRSPSDGMILTASGLAPSSGENLMDISEHKRPDPGFRVSEVFLTH